MTGNSLRWRRRESNQTLVVKAICRFENASSSSVARIAKSAIQITCKRFPDPPQLPNPSHARPARRSACPYRSTDTLIRRKWNIGPIATAWRSEHSKDPGEGDSDEIPQAPSARSLSASGLKMRWGVSEGLLDPHFFGSWVVQIAHGRPLK